MGQFKTRGAATVEEGEKQVVEVEMETRTDSEGRPELTIPKNIFEKLGKQETNIYKTTIENQENRYTYIIEYKDREVVISFSQLKPGKYRVRIEPYTLQDFLRKFNQTAKQKYAITLEIKDKTLILNLPNGTTTATDKWIYEKEHGGTAKITADYPSETRPKTTLIYKNKRGEPTIRILSPRKGRRDSQELVTKIEATPHGIAITYKHGKKQKITYIPVIPIEKLNRYYVPANAITYSFFKCEKNIEYYKVKIVDSNTYRALQQLFIIGYKTGKKGNKYKEKIGIAIAMNFLENVLKMDVIDNPVEEYNLREKYGIKVSPDLIAQIGSDRYMIEVKFLSYPSMIKHRLKSAENEINEQINKLRRVNALTSLNLNYKAIIIVVYNFKEALNEGILLIKRYKI